MKNWSGLSLLTYKIMIVASHSLTAHLNLRALATRAGSPEDINVPRAGSPGDIKVPRAGSPSR